MSAEILAAWDLAPDADAREVKRAYARRLKQIDVETDPDRFQTLRMEYESALWWANNRLQFTYELGEEDALAAGITVDVSPAVEGQQQLKPHDAADASSQHDSVRVTRSDIDHAAIETLVSTVTAAIKRATDDAEAEQLANAALRDPAVESFAAREEFELRLAQVLCAAPALNAHSILGVAESLHWHEDTRGLHAIDSHLAMNLSEKLYAARGVARLQQAQRWLRRVGTVLLGHHQPLMFRLSIISADELAEINSFVDAHRWVNFEGINQAPDKRVLEWWALHGRGPRATIANALICTLFGLACGLFVNSKNFLQTDGLNLLLGSGVGVMSGALALGGWLGFLTLLDKHAAHHIARLERHIAYQFGWLIVVPILLVFAVIDSATTHLLPTAVWVGMLAVCVYWLIRIARFPTDLGGVLATGLILLICSGWTMTYFSLPNVFLAFVVTATLFLLVVSAMREGSLFAEHWSSATRAFFRLGWLALAGLTGFALWQVNAPVAVEQQALRAVWVLALVWGTASVELYSEKLGQWPWWALVGTSVLLSSSSPFGPGTGRDGFAFMLVATIFLTLYLIVNFTPPLDKKLRE